MKHELEIPTPAQQLVGKELSNGWRVVEILNRPEGATGGHFSTSYVVESPTHGRAFLKAIDYQTALKSPEPARALQAMTAAFNYERDLLEVCRDKRLSRVVTVLDSGTIPPQDAQPSSVVEYLIFELADGDIRSFVEFGKAFETAWALRTIHQTAAALQQLHSVGIAHQNLKPSNVLLFDNSQSKVADLGRASLRVQASPHDEQRIAGDTTYAPPELPLSRTP